MVYLAHLEADQTVDLDERQVRAAAEGRSPHSILVTATKSAIVFLRAYQDALYGAANIISGNAWGRYPQMKKALQGNGLLPDILREEVPGYAPWFLPWKEVRDEIKLGIGSASLTNQRKSARIVFHRIKANGGQGDLILEVGVPQFTAGLRLSSRVGDRLAIAAQGT